MKVEQNWLRLQTITAQLTSVSMSQSHDLELLYASLLTYTENDRTVDGRCMLGMKRAPGSHSRHHAHEGGLVCHLLQMWEIWCDLRKIILDHSQRATHPNMTDSYVWRAILHHDLNKVWKYVSVTSDPWMVEYAKNEDPTTSLLGDTHKSLWLLNRATIPLNIPLHNALICAEGGFTKCQPQVETVLAKTVYILDEMSANVIDRLQRNAFWDSKVGGIGEEEKES